MSVTNQQIIDYLESMNQRQHEEIQALSERVGRLEKAFNDHLLSSKNGNASTGQRLSLMEETVRRHQINWDKVWRYAIGVIITAVVGAILAVVGLGVLP